MIFLGLFLVIAFVVITASLGIFVHESYKAGHPTNNYDPGYTGHGSIAFEAARCPECGWLIRAGDQVRRSKTTQNWVHTDHRRKPNKPGNFYKVDRLVDQLNGITPAERSEIARAKARARRSTKFT